MQIRKLAVAVQQMGDRAQTDSLASDAVNAKSSNDSMATDSHMQAFAKAFRSKNTGKATDDNNQLLPKGHNMGRLVFAILTDLLGDASYLADVFGPAGEIIVDGVTVPFLVRNYNQLFPGYDAVMVFGTFEELMPYSDWIPTATVALLIQWYCPCMWKVIGYMTKYIRMLAPYAWYLAGACILGAAGLGYRAYTNFDHEQIIVEQSDLFYADVTLILVLCCSAIVLCVIKYNTERAAKTNRESIQSKIETVKSGGKMVAKVARVVSGSASSDTNVKAREGTFHEPLLQA